jgi:hypothetical protein
MSLYFEKMAGFLRHAATRRGCVQSQATHDQARRPMASVKNKVASSWSTVMTIKVGRFCFYKVEAEKYNLALT